MTDTVITDRPLRPQDELDGFLAALHGEGAVVSFVGVARNMAASGAVVERLFLDHHPTLTLASIQQIADLARERFAVSAVRVVHRFGEVVPGDAIVFVAAASVHRRAAFEAADFMMDRLKTEAVFWKREDASDRSRWIEPSASDYADTARWS
ncbi:molybdenum cofactor biosynthesis protein MoaE [Tsuneonella sp. HG249]